MSEFDRLVVFGKYLVQECGRLQMELNSVCLNDKLPIDTIRRKAGHLEAYQFILQRFEELYKGDLNKFQTDYLEDFQKEKESEDNKGRDDSGTSSEDGEIP